MVRCHLPHFFARVSSNDIPHFLLLLVIKIVFISRDERELLNLVHGTEDLFPAISAQKIPETLDVSILVVHVSVVQDLDEFGVLSFLGHLHEELDELLVAEDLYYAMEQSFLLFLEQLGHKRVRLAPAERVIQGVDQAPDLQHFQLLATVVEHGF